MTGILSTYQAEAALSDVGMLAKQVFARNIFTYHGYKILLDTTLQSIPMSAFIHCKHAAMISCANYSLYTAVSSTVAQHQAHAQYVHIVLATRDLW